MNFLSRLAASKVASYIGVALSLVATLCITMRSDMLDAFPGWGARLCAFVALGGAVVGAFGKGVADRREEPPVADDGLEPTFGIASTGGLKRTEPRIERRGAKKHVI